MLIKIIKCIVNEDSKNDFHLAQTKWTKLEFVRGFIAQVGGWNLINKNEAIIIGIWESLDAYTFFMTEIHDEILGNNKQSKSYEKIEVSLWETNEILNDIDIKSFRFSEIVNIENYNSNINNLRKKTVFMTKVKNENERKVLILNNELEEIDKNTGTLIKLDKEWTV